VTVIFAGGGTGGHLYPAIAIADALRDRSVNVAFIGTADRLEATIVPKAGYPLLTIASRPVPRSLSLGFARTIASNLRGTLQSLRLLAAHEPDLLIATGGYVSFPVALAARIRRLTRRSHFPVILLEPNAAPGLTNRLLAPIVDEIWGAAPGSDSRFAAKYEATGIPIRASLRRLPPRDVAIARLGLDPSRRTLVAMGGSQGARTINDALASLTRSGGLPRGWQLLHLTGQAEYERVTAALRDQPAAASHVTRAYLDDMADAYAVADLLLTRAGASTLGELRALGQPAIVVPYPFAAEDHQSTNAAQLESSGAVVVLADSDLQAGGLPALLAATAEPERLAELTERAERLKGSDPLLAILARIDTLLARTGREQ
jgi:UDP-N-acetylglucosamine--N-acetylmuramyl-(pentapeptide) pyrophosphoryl-undecaprenol N-acetylglucosamine transferase